MNIAIIVHSNTGTTRKFADIITGKLKEIGNEVDLIQIETDVPIKSGTVKRHKEFTITNLPSLQKYNVVMVGGPVWAFSASPVIVKCISLLGDLEGKKVLPFVTMGFPLKGMGGKQAISVMSKTAMNSKATVLPGAIVSKLFHKIDEDMNRAADDIVSRL